jgi:hypothetical protein
MIEGIWDKREAEYLANEEGIVLPASAPDV